jgi:lysophospholipase
LVALLFQLGLAESQSLWVHSFEDYVDDLLYFVTTISKEYSRFPMFLVAHSMGGLIAAIAMSRLPAMINRAVLCAPMIRNKCGMKVINYKFPLPQPLTYWITSMACYAGGGSMHALGYFKEKPTDELPLNVVTSDREQLDQWQQLRMKYHNLIATCVTNDWVIHAIRATKKFSTRYSFVRTNTLILRFSVIFLQYVIWLLFIILFCFLLLL